MAKKGVRSDIPYADRLLTARKDKDGRWKIEQGIRMIDDQWKVFGTRTKGVNYWMAMPDAPEE